MKSAAEKLDILIFGPMTNLASAILVDPAILPKIRAHVMGLHYDAKAKPGTKTSSTPTTTDTPWMCS